VDFYAIGQEEVILGLSFAGSAGKAVESRDEALEAFKDACERQGGVLVVTEETSALLEREIAEWQMRGECPLIVELPPLAGHVEGKRSLMESIREAIGLRI